MIKYSKRTLRNLKGLDPRLIIIVSVLIERGNVDLTIIDGLRTAEEQLKHFESGASKLDGTNRKSYHQTGKAIDFIPYPFDGNWNNLEQFIRVGEELKKISKEFGVNCRYGGDWEKFRDYPHFEIE